MLPKQITMPKRKCIRPRCGEITHHPVHLIEFSTPSKTRKSTTTLATKRVVFIDPLWEHYMEFHNFQVPKSLVSLITCPQGEVVITVKKDVKYQPLDAEVLFDLKDFENIPRGGVNYDFIKKLKEIIQ